ncbi:DNA-directed RNA polymerase [Candidatus Pacearchaeota archaeon CG10_big_fil_rev_8_21_14_0_10_35_13]|nr:MAG: DNA-directed RNA polymerase [Candidatus Pacearchaeota archaeon CG10_big_fil_rev_8_21_14_0_10_35_13]
MFNLAEVEDYVRVEPKLFGLETKDAVRQQLKNTYSGFLNKELGFIISVVEVMKVEEGVVIPGDGAVYYNSRFKLLIWKPEIQELIPGIVKDVANFGAFVSLGVAEGLIHITQVTDDYVTYSKTGTLTSKNGKKSLKKGDQCLARIVAISYKAEQPKVGLTMRQPGLGKLEWIKDEKRKGKKEAVEEKVKIKNTKGKKK